VPHRGHQALAVDRGGDGVGMVAGGLVGRDDPAQRGTVPLDGPAVLAQHVIGHAEQPGQRRLTVDHHPAPSAPGLQEDR
jgi:hypothetical protein